MQVKWNDFTPISIVVGVFLFVFSALFSTCIVNISIDDVTIVCDVVPGSTPCFVFEIHRKHAKAHSSTEKSNRWDEES